MKPHDESLSDVPGIDPDGQGYVALVIDFDDMFDEDMYDDFEQLGELDAVVVTADEDVAPPRRRRLRALGRSLGVLGAAGVLALAAWGIYRHRAA